MLYDVFLQILTAPAGYNSENSVLLWIHILLSIGFLFTHIHLRKLKKEKAVLEQRMKEQEAELIRLKEQKSDTGDEPE